ncbi:MAG: tail fiber domain-containing protein [Planctomycetota bacterium]
MRKHTNIIIIAIFFIFALFSLGFGEESITITTYYPSPYGVYNELQLYPHSSPVTPCNNTTRGTMYYNSTDGQIKVCDGAGNWPTAGGGGGVYWNQTGTSLYPTNTTWNVGIGTTSPGTKLDIDATGGSGAAMIRLNTPVTSDSGIILRSGGSDRWYIYRRGWSNDLSFWSTSGGGGERVTFTEAGNVGIGTTSPGHKLTLTGGNLAVTNGNIYSASDRYLHFNYGVDDNYFIVKTGTSLFFNTGGSFTFNGGNVGIGGPATTYKLQLYTDSAAKPTSNTWTISSDKRIKKNISDFTDGLNIVMKLKPHTYQYNGLGGKGYDGTGTHIGFVAQEVEPIAPYMVETSKGTIGGVQISDFKNYQGHALSFILVNAIQEQQDIIKAQQLEIDGLKVRLDKLEEKQTQTGK